MSWSTFSPNCHLLHWSRFPRPTLHTLSPLFHDIQIRPPPSCYYIFWTILLQCIKIQICQWCIICFFPCEIRKDFFFLAPKPIGKIQRTFSNGFDEHVGYRGDILGFGDVGWFTSSMVGLEEFKSFRFPTFQKPFIFILVFQTVQDVVLDGAGV